MYGWEFPPRISGGLGIACHAIVKELAKKDIGITLVLPHTVCDTVNDGNVNIIGCDYTASLKKGRYIKDLSGINLKYAPVLSKLSPYASTKDLQHLFTSPNLQEFLRIIAKISLPEEIKQLAYESINPFINGSAITDNYGANLLFEVFRYALIAGELANTTEHDVIHAHDWLTVLAATQAKQISNKPFVFHIHALETDRSGYWTDKRIFAIEKYGMEQADEVITVSQYTKNLAVQHYGISPDKISVVHNGIYLENLAKSKKANPKRPAMVLFLGRVTHQKGPAFFVDTAHKILANYPDVQFVIAGTGDLLVPMIEKVAALRIGKNVHFLGFLDHDKIKNIFNLADVYVMSSISEPFGLSPLEALANHVPAIITKQSGVAEVLNHTLTTDFWDTDDMAAKVLAMLKYPTLRNASLKNSAQDLKALTWEKTASKIVYIYKKVANKVINKCKQKRGVKW